MRHVRACLTLSVLLLITALLPGVARAQGDAIRISGSTTIAPVMKSLIQVYMMKTPEQSFTLTSSGSADGVTALARRTADIAMVSREVTVQESARLVRLRIPPRQTIIGLDGVVPIVHPDNPVQSITIEQARSVYLGEIVNWKTLGGSDLPITPYGRRANSGSHDIWFRKVMGLEEESARVQVVASNDAIARAVGRDRNGIGYVGLGFVSKTTKPLALDSVPASARAVLSGDYPLARSLNLYTSEAPSREVEAFLDFVLGSEGQAIIKNAGFVPVE